MTELNDLLRDPRSHRAVADPSMSSRVAAQAIARFHAVAAEGASDSATADSTARPASQVEMRAILKRWLPSPRRAALQAVGVILAISAAFGINALMLAGYLPRFDILAKYWLEDFADAFGQGLAGSPLLMAVLAWAAEYLGAIALACGFAVRWVCIPLMFTMVVAMTTVHWDHGWQAVHDLKSPHPAEHAEGAIERLHRARSILEEHGNIEWLTEHGNFVVSNNGIEWAATYLIMLLALFFLGGGRLISVDYWLARTFRNAPPGD